MGRGRRPRRHRARPRRLGLDRLSTGSGAAIALRRVPHDRKFRSASSRPSAARARSCTELARKAEALGYSSLFVPDHFVDHDLAPTVALAHVAAVTDTLRVGPLVLGNDYKHPGRARPRDGDARPALRRPARARHRRGLDDRRLREGGHAARPARRAHRAARRVDHDPEGPVRRRAVHVPRRALPVTDLDGMPKPVQRPTCRSSSAAAGRRSSRSRRARRRSSASTRTCARATASRRDAAQSLRPAATDQKLAVAARGRGRRLRRPRDPDAARLRARHRRRRRASSRRWRGSFGVSETTRCSRRSTLVGSSREIVELLEQRRERWQMSYIVVPIESTRDAGAVVARLAGN